jgi:head-tail adaptor
MKRQTGKAHELVQIHRPVETQGASGAVRVDWSVPELVAERFAAVLPRASQRFERFYAEHQTATAAYEMAGFTECRPGWRLTHSGQVLEIVGVLTEDNRPPAEAKWMTLMVRGAR